MIRIWSFFMLVHAGAAVREDVALRESRESSFVELEEEMEMKLVPAKISKAIRRSMRLTAEAGKAAEEKKQKAAEAAEHATTKKTEAEEQLNKANKMKDELQIGAERLQKIKDEAEKLMESGKQAQAEWKKEKEALEAMEKQCDAEGKKVDAKAKEVQEMIKKLIGERQQMELALLQMKKKKNVQEQKVEKLEMASTAAGEISREKQEAAQKAENKFNEAKKKLEKQEKDANNAAGAAAIAEVEENKAKEEVIAAEEEVEAKRAEKDMILELRNSVQAYYDVTDAMTKSMEASLTKVAEGEEAWDLMRKDPNVKQSMVNYNLMVQQFRRVFFDNQNIYGLVADSTKEIHDNAQAAWLLQCDPNEVLEEEARKSGSLAKLDEHCGRGLWKHFEVERQNFPSPDEAPPPEPVESTEAQVSPEEVPKETLPETPETEDQVPEEPESEPSSESKSESSESNDDDEDVSNAEPAEEESNPAMIQVRDLDMVREIRKHRQRGEMGGAL